MPWTCICERTCVNNNNFAYANVLCHVNILIWTCLCEHAFVKKIYLCLYKYCYAYPKVYAYDYVTMETSSLLSKTLTFVDKFCIFKNIYTLIWLRI